MSMDDKKIVKIVHQDIEDANYLIVIEIYNTLDKYDTVYRVDLPDDFQETKKVYKLYPFVHN